MTERYTSSKTYRNYPCAHRQWKHQGHCAYIHGYSREFIFHFDAKERDEHGWVVGFGDLKPLKEWLDYMFDHTLLIASDDPEIELFKKMDEQGICDLRTLPDNSIEGCAKFILEYVNKLLLNITKGRSRCFKVEVRENDKNSASYSIE
mgnify:FL=1